MNPVFSSLIAIGTGGLNMYQILIRDRNLNKIGEVTDYQKLDIVSRFNDVGSFALDLPTDSVAARALIEPQAGIIVKKNGVTLFSGRVMKPKRKWDVNNDTLTLSGVDDNAVLNNLAFPEINGNFSLADYDVRTGKAESIMKQYVADNIGPSALSYRSRVSIEPDQAIGSTVTGRARFHTLNELLTTLALAGGGLGFRVLQSGNGLQFRVYQPRDLTGSAIFSPLLGNLMEFEYSKEYPEANYLYVAGGGEGKDRIILPWADNSSVAKYGMVEAFVDQRNTSVIDELAQAGDEELVSKGEKATLSITPIETDGLQFGRDYNLGDKVSVVLTQPTEVVTIEELYYFLSAYQVAPFENERILKIQEKFETLQDVVRELKITITPNGESISPVIGTDDSTSSAALGLFSKMKRMARRISNMERT